MNESAQKMFDEIVKMNPEDLNTDQAAFLRARRSYLTHDQERIFAIVLKAETVVSDDATPQVSPETPKDEEQSTNGVDEMRTEYKKEAEKLGITVTDEMTSEGILDLIKEARKNK